MCQFLIHLWNSKQLLNMIKSECQIIVKSEYFLNELYNILID